MDQHVHKFIVEMGRAAGIVSSALRELAKTAQPERTQTVSPSGVYALGPDGEKIMRPPFAITPDEAARVKAGLPYCELPNSPPP